jgi:site-specific DNA recombinase
MLASGKGKALCGCDARTVPESQIEQVLVAAINQTWCDKDTFLATLQRNIEAVLESEKGQPLTDIDKRLAELQEELLKRTGARADYEDVAEEIYRLREDKQKLQQESAGRDEQKKRIADMGTFLQEQPTALTEYDEPLVRRLVEKVIVYEDKFTVEFKSGVTVDVDE